MCLHSVTISISFSMLLYIGISDTTMLPDHMATFLGQKSADDKNLGFAKPFHLAYFDDFNVDIPSSNNIHSRFHISDGYKYPIFEILCTKLWRKQELRLIYTGRKIHIGIDKIIEKNDPVVNSSICSLTSVSDTARCFSCMSRLYEAVWPALSSIYKRPKNFTDLCNDNDLDPQYVPFTYCPTICIRMWEEPTVADEQLVGVRIRGHIRGCLDELLYNGFNQTIVTWYRWMHRDSCRQYRKRELFKLPTELSDDSYITVCTCYADYCNGRSSAGTTGRGASHCPFFLVLLCSFIILFFIQRISWSVRIFVYHISYL